MAATHGIIERNMHDVEASLIFGFKPAGGDVARMTRVLVTMVDNLI
jgi:hypothetical protein